MADRPDPDALLAYVQREDSRARRGKLKIYLGMVAGVGKTFAMLDGARQAKAEDGIDVVVGYVETHGRAETGALLEGMEIIPRRTLEYRGVMFEEMDIDAILARKPALVLVDELAHTNVPGSRHLKRYQDVLELIDAGIDVWTTVNVQHFDSRADTVQAITGITVQERVPDSILELADKVELIDLSPEDLRERLYEGKVYTAERVETAANNFFRIGNLTALREMALRLTAERVDHQLQDYREIKRITTPWKSAERLMVAVSPSPLSERLIRWTRRMAYNLEAPWIAVHVDSAKPLSPENKERLARNLKLASDLGAEVITTVGSDIIDALIRVAQQRNVSQIVVGKPAHSRIQDILRGGTIVNRLIGKSGDIDVYVVTGDEPESVETRPLIPPIKRHSSLRQYVYAALVIALVTLLSLPIEPFLGYQAIGLIELFAVLVIAAYLGRGPAVLAATVSALTWDILFIPPVYTFQVVNLEDYFVLGLYFVIALFAGNLTARLRQQEMQARALAERTLALYRLARQTSTAVNMDDILRSAVDEIGRVFNAEVAIFLSVNGLLALEAHGCSTLHITEKDFSIAKWAFDNGKPAGRYTDTLPLANATYLPLLTPSGTVGALGIRTRDDSRLTRDAENQLDTFARQIALVIEREMLDEAAEKAAMLQASEQFATSLLNSISHEFRTPIAAITGASSSLLDPKLPDDAKGALVEDIEEAADRLNWLVGNLLDMTRLESGRVQPKLEWCDVSDLIGSAVRFMGKRVRGRPIKIAIAPNLPLVQMDFGLMEQVIANLLHNAVSYTPPETPIEISAAVEDESLCLRVADHGEGIAAEALERIFDKFYRSPGVASGGTGLGLSIAKGFVEAHGGMIQVANRAGGGAEFTIRLPMTPPPPVQESTL
ncbi:MAG: sensor histidine kinase KdpD [Anaerolinea sp.]|nr:sensor histidine kinase KdpD [Anaerolinea sp.]